MMIRVGVVAHTSRVAEAKALTRMVGADFVSVDNGILGGDANHVAVQRHLAGLGGDWSVVLEDDAVVVPGFREQLASALEVAPGPVVSLYLGRLRPPQYQRRLGLMTAHADKAGACWLSAPHMLHAVGYAIRRDVLPSLLEFDCDSPADERIGLWRGGEPVFYCWPSLVDHADLPTVTAHPDGQVRCPGRVAWRAGVRDVWTDRWIAM